MILKNILFVTCLFALPGSASGSSCRELSNRYYLSCTDGVCTPAFSIIDVSSFGTCGRRLTVNSIEPNDADFLSGLIKSRSMPVSDGVAIATFANRYWGEEANGLEDMLWNEFKYKLAQKEKPDESSVRPNEFARLIMPYLPDNWINENVAGISNIGAVKRRYEREARWALLVNLFKYSLYWGGTGLALLLYLHSVHVYFFRLYNAEARAKKKWAVYPLAMQFAIAAIAIAGLLSIYSLWIGSILLPAVVCTLLVAAYSWWKSDT